MRYKILYAANNNENSKIQLYRFYNAIKDYPYIIKFSAYKNFSPKINIDWTLDPLTDLEDNKSALNTENFKTYLSQVEYFQPDLIISDLEYFTSQVSIALNIPIWQCSSDFIHIALDNIRKYQLKLFTNFYKTIERRKEQELINILDNSNKLLVYSYLNDVDSSIKLKKNFDWISPYHNIGKDSSICHHNIVIASSKIDRNIINKIKDHRDIIYFTDFTDEYYNNIILKKINNDSEYYCNLKNSNFFICRGESNYLADAYYNGKKSIIFTNYNDKSSVINSTIACKFNFANIVNINDLERFLVIKNNNFIPNKRKSMFLLEKINEYFKINDI